jgi:hypothetical protein
MFDTSWAWNSLHRALAKSESAAKNGSWAKTSKAKAHAVPETPWGSKLLIIAIACEAKAAQKLALH